MITQQIKLNLIPGQVFPRVNASQYDSGTRTLQMALYNGDQVFNIASGMTAVVQGTKPDKTGFQYAATITEGSNIATLDIIQQMTAVKGDVTCELVISNGNNRIATVNFIIYVEAAALADDTVISETDLPLIEEAAELAERIDGIVQQVDEDAQTASNAADKAEAYGTHPPYIGANGNWYVYNVTTQQYEDSGVEAQGPLSGLTDVELSNLAGNDIIAYDATAQKWKNSSKFETLTNQVKDMNNVYGAKNLLPNNEVTQVRDGITFTVNPDKSITLSGTASNLVYIDLPVSLTDGVEYTASGISGGSSSTYQVHLQTSDGSSTSAGSFTSGTLTFTKDSSNYNVGIYRVRIKSGTAFTTPITIYPMIRLASIEDNTYVPYAKTNQQLTDDIDTVKSCTSLLTTNPTTWVDSSTAIGLNEDLSAYSRITINGYIDTNVGGRRFSISCDLNALRLASGLFSIGCVSVSLLATPINVNAWYSSGALKLQFKDVSTSSDITNTVYISAVLGYK